VLAEALATPVAAALARVVAVADLPPPDHTPAEARDAADRILDRPEYRWDDDQNVVQRIVEWIAERFADLLEPLGFGAGGLPVWVGWLILLGLAGLVGYLVYRARGGWGRAGAPGVVRGGRVVVSAGEADVDWAAEVERCERAGLWRDGLRARYRVLVGELAARGLIGDLVGRTTGELVADVRVSAPAVAPAFAAATAIFEETWYGGASVGAAERDRFLTLAAEVRAAADRARATARRG
jgi:Domain of unknown function (DUF4129)